MSHRTWYQMSVPITSGILAGSTSAMDPLHSRCLSNWYLQSEKVVIRLLYVVGSADAELSRIRLTTTLTRIPEVASTVVINARLRISVKCPFADHCSAFIIACNTRYLVFEFNEVSFTTEVW